MSISTAAPRLSFLDRSRTREGHDPGEALRDTVRLAQEVERLGYHRFWVSEHHSVPGVAGSAPTVLAAAVAGATSTLRVGTGGVMLPNHLPFVVAEQFGVLASLFPGRIDMGLGRSVGFTDGVRRALGRGKEAADDFGALLAELLGWLDGTRSDHPGVHAYPAEGAAVPAFVLAVNEGASIAAAAGLPLVVGDLRGRERLLRTVETYRDGFRPSARAARPYVIVSGTVAVARTEEAAHRLLVPEAWAMARARTTGAFPPLRPAGRIEPAAMSPKERRLYEEGLAGHLYGTPDRVADELGRVIGETGADEVLVTTSTYDREALRESLRLLAGAVGQAPVGAGPDR
ncbi:LLM class flavin-dependent oxidoreductase [uncultured Streptomyces sp.]|uniref:LLM class flavin-dependent oxidoreductase n=1 Tax=uncultured Streptomyces sp. TaxID=174707 RepID=UPI0026063D1B|nr:LLM class flavin-dependent oxidoreductase [uncultured Streptomyces sp.]